MSESKADNLLCVSDVRMVYEGPAGGQPVQVLDGISLSVSAGESVGIVGPSGSGKSTLLNIIGGLDRPTSGTVALGGRTFSALSEPELADVRSRQIGFVFQLHHLLPQCTVLENVLLPTLPIRKSLDADAVCKRAETLLQRVGLGDRLHHRPPQLSGGERQRAAVVRALINEPCLLLADEPTGSLDHETASRLADLLVELNRESAVALIVVTHSRELAERLDHRHTLRDGELIPSE